MEKSQHTKSYQKLTAALREAREAAGLTQAQVAEKLGLYASFVSKVESGERRIDVIELAQFCKVYDVELVALLRAAGLCK
jgi:transcriptional regulator with XRE-family HTH domain